jgi:hypothetical protein
VLPTRNAGLPAVNIDVLDDIEIEFEHSAKNRP